MSMFRTRWAAVGAAVAVTLGAGGIGLVQAEQDSGDRPVTITIEPCRLRDTRPDRGIGGRITPLGPAEAYTVTATGPSGNCTIPTDATGLILNVTAVDATEATNLRLYPTGGTVPTTSNLNPRPGAPPTPNGATVGLNGSGEFDIRNANGTVDVIIDVTAYLVHHTHDDRYYTETEIDGLAADIEAANSFISLDPAAFHMSGSAYFDEDVGLVLPDTTARFSFGFTLPPDFEPGGGFDFRLVWMTDDVTNCTHDMFDLDFIYAFRYEVPPVGVFTYRIVPVFGTPLGPYEAQWLAFRSNDQNNLQPRTPILVNIDRDAQTGCTTSDVRLVGADVTYDGGAYPTD